MGRQTNILAIYRDGNKYEFRVTGEPKIIAIATIVNDPICDGRMKIEMQDIIKDGIEHLKAYPLYRYFICEAERLNLQHIRLVPNKLVDLQGARRFVEQTVHDRLDEVEWTWAKTYAKTAPHYYILKKDYPSLFEQVAEIVRLCGYNGLFWKQTFRYANIGSYKYWHYNMVMNRAEITNG